MSELPEAGLHAAAELRGSLDAHLSAHDKAGAVATALEAVRERRIGIGELYGLVLVPLLVDTGAAWQRGKIGVWEEHLASATLRTIIEALYPEVLAASAAGAGAAGRVLLACPTGEQHDLGLRMLADRLQLAGWDVHYLGPDTPTADIAAAAESLGVSLVALSAATHYNVVLARRVVDELKRLLPGVRVGIGGPAVTCAADWPEGDLLTDESLGLPNYADPVCEG